MTAQAVKHDHFAGFNGHIDCDLTLVERIRHACDRRHGFPLT